jgi:hypothetical protein
MTLAAYLSRQRARIKIALLLFGTTERRHHLRAAALHAFSSGNCLYRNLLRLLGLAITLGHVVLPCVSNSSSTPRLTNGLISSSWLLLAQLRSKITVAIPN